MNVFFRLAAAGSAVFVVTILAMVAAMFGDGQAPPARLLDQYSGWLIAGEVAAILVCMVLALAIDRAQIRRAMRPPIETAPVSPAAHQPSESRSQ